MKFNTAIAALMTLLNDIFDNKSLSTEQFKAFISLLCPFAPHICEELWEKLGEKELLSLSKWPEYDEAKTVDAVVEVAVQICGKFRGTITMPVDATKEQFIEAAKNDPKIAPWIEGKQIIKEICVPGKLVNIVAK